MKHWFAASLSIVGLLAGASAWAVENREDFPAIQLDHPAIDHASEQTDDPVARLQAQIDKGQTKLEYDSRFGYLPSLLKHLQLNLDSQILVFSKTSFQGTKISPHTPRALYFNDGVAVGSVQHGEVLELASVDPKRGVLFYTLDVAKSDKPTFNRRDNDCLSCHLIPGTLNIPGLLVTSVIVAPDGSLRFPGAGIIIDGRSPLEQRWGGWYVTGTTGELQHQGNAVAPDPDRSDVLDRRRAQNLMNLDRKVDTGAYLAPTSDVVALMTLEHQTRVTNLITRLGWETRVAMRDGKLDESRSRLASITEQLITYMLFADEARIREPIEGVSSFTKSFPDRGPRDKQGRSLRDFDLHQRLFRYPLSYMIYSDVFEGMPDIAKGWVYKRLYEVLAGKDTSQAFARLSVEDRRAVLEIVRNTKPGLPAYWKAEGAPTQPQESACCQ